MNVAIITVGDELLIGQVVDTNSAWMGIELTKKGVNVTLKCAVSDELGQITKALDIAFQHADVILMTGGLGPTKDDITKKALATYFNCEMTFSQPTFGLIESLFSKRNIPMTDAHREQCKMPELAELLENKMGTAPGMWMQKEERVVVSMPGVPYEMKFIMTHSVLPRLEQLSDRIYRQKTIRTAGIGETSVAQLIEPTLINHKVKVAYLPSVGQVRIRLSLDGDELRIVEDTLATAVEEVREQLVRHIYGYDDDTLEATIGLMLQSRSMTLGTAESCTGGYLAHMLTSIPGSSAYYMGSMVTYSNKMKIKLLGVPSSTLALHGAVSEETVTSMVGGALRELQVDLAVAISGISGPDGGTEEKPVGTVWIAVGDKDRVTAKKYLFSKDRIINIKYTAVYALIMIRKFLLRK